jgi:hypothetical protein
LGLWALAPLGLFPWALSPWRVLAAVVRPRTQGLRPRLPLNPDFPPIAGGRSCNTFIDRTGSLVSVLDRSKAGWQSQRPSLAGLVPFSLLIVY